MDGVCDYSEPIRPYLGRLGVNIKYLRALVSFYCTLAFVVLNLFIKDSRIWAFWTCCLF